MRVAMTDWRRAAYDLKTGYSDPIRHWGIFFANRCRLCRPAGNGLGGVEMAKPMQASDLAGYAHGKDADQGSLANPKIIFPAQTPCL